MARAIDNRSRLVQPLLIFGVWTLIGLSFAGQFFIASSQLGRPVSWQTALNHSLADWYVIALLSILPFALSRRFRLDGPQWWSRFFLHLVAGGLFSVLFVLIRSLVAVLQLPAGSASPDFLAMAQTLLVKTWHFNMLIYWVILSVAHALAFYRGFQEREARTAELERHLVEARLQALQMQLNPHFLFNTLHAISALMHENVDDADRMIARLSELLRHALESTDQHELTLENELSFLERYLDIEQTRFGERLEIQWSIDPVTRTLMVPNLILQPLVENAVQHGVEPYSAKGTVIIRSQIESDQLVLEVSNTGRAQEPIGIHEGVGLSNTRSRLEQLYGENQSFTLESGLKDAAFKATIRLPIRRESASDKIDSP